MTAREIVESAIDQIDTYRNPDITEARTLINAILSAAKLGSTGGDEITRLYFTYGVHGGLNIETKYSCRGCAMNDNFLIPTAIIESENPVKAAARWAAERALAKAQQEVLYAERALIQAKATLEQAQEDFSKV